MRTSWRCQTACSGSHSSRVTCQAADSLQFGECFNEVAQVKQLMGFKVRVGVGVKETSRGYWDARGLAAAGSYLLGLDGLGRGAWWLRRPVSSGVLGKREWYMGRQPSGTTGQGGAGGLSTLTQCSACCLISSEWASPGPNSADAKRCWSPCEEALLGQTLGAKVTQRRVARGYQGQ